MTEQRAPCHVTDGNLRIRPLRDIGSDYLLLAGWLSDHRVLAWYQGRDHPFDLPRARAEIGPIARCETEVNGCIIERASQPIGYLQFYPVLDSEEYALESVDGVLGLDLFLGDPELWGRGIGTRAIRLVMGALFERPRVRRLLIDPHVENLRAIRAYEKCGFRKVKVLPAHELHEGEYRDCWLMDAHPDGTGDSSEGKAC